MHITYISHYSQPLSVISARPNASTSTDHPTRPHHLYSYTGRVDHEGARVLVLPLFRLLLLIDERVRIGRGRRRRLQETLHGRMAAPDDVMAAIVVPIGDLQFQLTLFVAVTQLDEGYGERFPVGVQVALHDFSPVDEGVGVVLVDATDGEERVALAEPVLLVDLAGAQ